MNLTKRQKLAWSQRGYKDGARGEEYASANAKEFGGEEAELSYAVGYRIGKRERLALKKAVA